MRQAPRTDCIALDRAVQDALTAAALTTRQAAYIRPLGLRCSSKAPQTSDTLQASSSEPTGAASISSTQQQPTDNNLTSAVPVGSTITTSAKPSQQQATAPSTRTATAAVDAVASRIQIDGSLRLAMPSIGIASSVGADAVAPEVTCSVSD